MLTRRIALLGVVLLAGIGLATSASAQVNQRFSQAAFDSARAAGKPILVEVSAPWCPVCKAQKPILSELRAQPKFKDLVIFEVDFDSQKDVLKAVGASRQSTLIVYRGTRETARSVGETNKGAIETLLTTAL